MRSASAPFRRHRATRTTHSRRAARGLLAALAILGLGLAGGPAHATVPATMSYQGVLRDPGGAPLPDGEYAFVFRLFNAGAGGTTLWQESQELLVTAGLFNATLGAVTPLNLPFDAQYWLETAVDGSTLSPRVQLASSPYAQRAVVAEALVGGGGSGDITAVHADDGLTGGATSGEAHLAVNAGPGLTIASDQVRMTDAYVSGAAYDARFVNEAQAGSVTVDMITPNVVAGVDGVVNDGGNIDLVAGANVTITPDDASNTITIAAAGGGGGIGGSGTTGHVPRFTGPTVVGNSIVYEIGNRIGMGTTTPLASLHVENIYGGPTLVLSDPNNTWLDLWTGNSDGVSAINIRRGGSYVTSLTESAEGFYVSRTAALGGIVLSSTTPDPATSAAVAAKYTGTVTADYVGLCGESAPSDFYGYGGKFRGGFTGAHGQVQPTGYDYYFGLRGDVIGGSGTNYGVYGLATGSGINYGVYGHAYGGSANYAGMFYGDVHVSSNLTVGGSKSFRIDHPLDPANKYLNHFCVESDQVLDTYTGNVVLDGAGETWVELAGWFDALNRDPRYQLTCVGGFAPVYVAERITGNRFKIAGGTPGLEISWQVTAVRSDPSIEKHRLPVEQEKPAPERGKYLEPELYGAPATARIGRVHQKQEPNH